MNTNQFQESSNMQYARNVTGLMVSAPPKRSFWQRMLGIKVANHSDDQETDQDSVKHTLSDSNFSHGAQGGIDVLINDSKLGVYVPKPVRSPLEAFKDAITDGTRVFCEQNVHPLYIEDKLTKFRVTGIKMYIPRSKNDLMAVIEQLPIDVRNRLARLRAQSASGAAEQLVFDEGFFGITIDIEPTVIDGQYVSLIASWAGINVDVKMVFTGQYVTVKPLLEVKPATAMQPSGEADSTGIEQNGGCAANVHAEPELRPTNPDVVLDLSMVNNADLTKQKLGSAAKLAVTSSETSPEVTSTKRVSRDTPLGLPQREKRGRDTYIPVLQRHPIARLRMLAHGAEDETVVEICTDMLPFVIGREYSASGHFEHGYNLGSDGDDSTALLVSREHLELRSFDRNENHFQVVNHALNRNGTYHNGCAVPERFIFKAGGQQNVMVLGGTSGPGTVRVAFEVA